MDVDGTSSDFWELVELFYSAWGHFRRLFDAYEAKVIRYAQDRGVDRKELKLSAEEVSGLFDFKALERLRNDYLAKLKFKAHKLFRTVDSTDTFDRSVSEIFHEVSILKEEHYAVKSYWPVENHEISSLILEEVHTYFPIRLTKINLLFSRANGRLESLFPQNTENRILVRSLYIYGDALLADIFPDGLRGLYSRMYPEKGAADGFYHAGTSFFDSGFWDLAREALEKSREILTRTGNPDPDQFEQIEQMLRQVRLKIS
ncbi:MAG: hypothetical protein ACYTFG_07960 [Planctomycetota bacterium]|jgi:hypothetical protein